MPLITNSKQIYSGTVIEFDNCKGFGYLKPDDNEMADRIFFHFSDIYLSRTYQLKKAEPGQSANFEIKTDSSNAPLKAVNVIFKT